MLRNRRKDFLIALVLVAPFLAIYALVFIYPTIQMFRISFTDAPLIGDAFGGRLCELRTALREPRFPSRSGIRHISFC